MLSRHGVFNIYDYKTLRHGEVAVDDFLRSCFEIFSPSEAFRWCLEGNVYANTDCFPSMHHVRGFIKLLRNQTLHHFGVASLLVELVTRISNS